MTDVAARRGVEPPPVLMLSPRALLSSLVSFEALVVLYMFAGLYKEDPRFAWIPFDPTSLFFGLSVVVGILILVLSPIAKRGLFPVFAGLLLVIWFGVSLGWSPSRVYGPDKVFFMATLGLWGLVAGAMIIAPDRTRVRRLCALLVLASVVAALEAVSLYLAGAGQRLAVGSGSYLALGRLCGLGATVVFAGWLTARSRFGVFGLVCLALFLLFGFVLAVGGGRGPMLATAGGLFVPLLVGIRLGGRGLRVAGYQKAGLGLVVLAAVALTVWVQTSEQTPETLRRLERIIASEDIGDSAEARAEYYQLAPALWAEAPLLGHGAGSWPLLTGWPDLARYPHNLFAEVAVEGGAIGLALLLGLLAVALNPVSFTRLRADPLAMVALMLFVNAFLNAMVSGDLPGNRVMFLFLGLLTLFALPQTESRPRLVTFLRRPPPAAVPRESLQAAPGRRP